MADGKRRPPLLELENREIYRAVYKATYCVKPTMTHDGVAVRFRQSQFEHITRESSRRDGVKDTHSPQRAQRLLWIKVALEDPELEFKAGWDKQKKRYDHKRRVTLMIDDFVVVIRLKSATEADFVTCYVADSPHTLKKLKEGPKWINPYAQA